MYNLSQKTQNNQVGAHPQSDQLPEGGRPDSTQVTLGKGLFLTSDYGKITVKIQKPHFSSFPIGATQKLNRIRIKKIVILPIVQQHSILDIGWYLSIHSNRS